MTWVDILEFLPIAMALRLLNTFFTIEKLRSERLWEHLYEEAKMPSFAAMSLMHLRCWTVRQWKFFIIQRLDNNRP